MVTNINPLNTELNPICHLLALLEGATIADVSGLRVKDGSAAYILRDLTPWGKGQVLLECKIAVLHITVCMCLDWRETVRF